MILICLNNKYKYVYISSPHWCLYKIKNLLRRKNSYIFIFYSIARQSKSDRHHDFSKTLYTKLYSSKNTGSKGITIGIYTNAF